MAYLHAAYPTVRISAESVLVYKQRLGNLPLADVVRAAQKHIDHHSTWPTIAELRAGVPERVCVRCKSAVQGQVIEVQEGVVCWKCYTLPVPTSSSEEVRELVATMLERMGSRSRRRP